MCPWIPYNVRCIVIVTIICDNYYEGRMYGNTNSGYQIWAMNDRGQLCTTVQPSAYTHHTQLHQCIKDLLDEVNVVLVNDSALLLKEGSHLPHQVDIHYAI